MMPIARHTVVLAALLIAATAALAQGGASQKAPSAKPAAPPPAAAPSTKTLFRFDCADRRSLEAAGDPELVKQLIAAVPAGSSQKFGDRAVLAELNGDGSPEVFVPVACGVTCNCDWLIVDTKAHRQLGVVNACVLNVKPSEGGWAELTTYSELSAADGVLMTYVMRDDGYRRFSTAHTDWQKAAGLMGLETWETGCK